MFNAGIHDAVRFGLEARLDELLANDPSLATVQDTLGQTPTDIALAVGRVITDVVTTLVARAAHRSMIEHLFY